MFASLPNFVTSIYNENENNRVKTPSVTHSRHKHKSWAAEFLPRDLMFLTELEYLEALGKYFPNGCLFRFQIERKMLENSGKVHLWHQHLHLCYASATWEKITNVPSGEVMNDFMLLTNNIVPDDLVNLSPLLYGSLVGCTEFNVEARYRYTDTETRWIQILTQPRREDRWVVCDGFILDVTARKKAEIELCEYRNKLEQMVQERTDELETANEELNAAGEELTNINEELSQTNKMLHDEIAARKEVMKKLEDSENKMRNFIQQSFEGMLIFDQQGRIIEWNRALEKITGMKKKDVLDKFIWDVIWQFESEEKRTPQELDDIHRNILDYMIDNHNEVRQENRALHFRNEVIRYMRVSMFPINLEDTCYFGRILHDMTRQRFVDLELSRYRSKLERMVEEKTRELTVAKEKAEESDRLNSAFLANMSHEVRTPLNAIVGLLNALDKEVQLSEDLREYVDIINSNSEILLRLIEDILDVAKIEANQLIVKSESFCADDVIDEMHTLFEVYLSTCQKTHIILETVKGGKVGKRMVYADPVRLRQILHNLLNNAIKFTDNGYIRFGYQMIKTDMLEFFVEDTGIGIPENQLDVIFQRFRQVEQGNNRRYGGTGLGLPISRSLVQLMGGNMHVTSTEGKGSTFFFTIPVANVSNFVANNNTFS